MSQENNDPSLFRVLAGETLVEYTAAATVSGLIVGGLYIQLAEVEASPISIAILWSVLSLSLYLLKILSPSLLSPLQILLSKR